MKKILLFVVTGGLLFAASAGGSYFWQKFTSGTAGTPPSTDPAHKDKAANAGINHYGQGTAPGMPDKIAVRPPVMQGTDAAVQLAEALREKEAALIERERKFTERQKHLDLVYKDIKGETAAVDALRKQVVEEYKALEKLMAQLEGKHTDLEFQREKAKTKMEDIRKEMVSIETAEREGVKRGSEIVESMPAEVAAEVIQQLADGGNIDSAAKMLSVMKQSKAAQVLALLPDRTLAAQLLKKLETLNKKTPPK